jgi:SM-20-related protein
MVLRPLTDPLSGHSSGRVDQLDISINPRLDPSEFARKFAKRRRIHIPAFLVPAAAERLLRHLRGREDWRLVINQGDKLFELDRMAQTALTPAKAAQLDLAVHKAAREGFQFRFETIRVPDEDSKRAADGTLLATFARFLSSPPALDFLRIVTGRDEIGFADAQGTAYGPHHFLTAHDDDVAGKNRLAAYVLNLTPEWRADWGGLLTFHRADGHIDEAFTPRFNALNLFEVPQRHSVSYVTPFVPNRRYAVTGWLRSFAAL